MDIITLYCKDENGHVIKHEYACSSWYHKPMILRSLAYYFKSRRFVNLLYVVSSKYGCRQFFPLLCFSYPVHDLIEIDYKANLPWIVIEFNDFASATK